MGPGGLPLASLKETWGLPSRFDCVYSDYITQGCPGGALAVAMSLRARCFFFPTHNFCPEAALLRRHDVFHDMFVCWSGLRRLPVWYRVRVRKMKH